MEKKSFEEIFEKLKAIEFAEHFDIVVAIARGGIIPGALVARKLGVNFATIVIIQKAKELLAKAALVKTFAVNGKADYSLFDEPCFKMPWA